MPHEFESILQRSANRHGGIFETVLGCTPTEASAYDIRYSQICWLRHRAVQLSTFREVTRRCQQMDLSLQIIKPGRRDSNSSATPDASSNDAMFIPSLSLLKEAVNDTSSPMSILTSGWGCRAHRANTTHSFPPLLFAFWPPPTSGGRRQPTSTHAHNHVEDVLHDSFARQPHADIHPWGSLDRALAYKRREFGACLCPTQ